MIILISLYDSQAKTVKDNTTRHKIHFVAHLYDILSPEGCLKYHHWFKSYSNLAGTGK